MNSVQLVGRLVRDIEVRYSDNGNSVAKFTLACDRRFKRTGEDNADFISCVAFKQTAEFLEKYFRKGQRIGLIGRIQTGSYTNKEGQKVYTTDIVVDNAEFVESRGNSEESGGFNQASRPEPSSAIGDGFMSIPDGVDAEGLPFN